jgi:hypothetical protein
MVQVGPHAASAMALEDTSGKPLQCSSDTDSVDRVHELWDHGGLHLNFKGFPGESLGQGQESP